MTPYYQADQATLWHGDCLDVLPSLEPDSVDLIVTDPPYFRVKGDDWDRQWNSADEFLAWLGCVADELRRVLKPNGSLYCFASVAMAARVECMLAERFTVLCPIVWTKPLWGHAHTPGRADKGALRSFFPWTERIIFCEQQGADSMAMGEAGYAAQCETLRGFVFEPLRAYLRNEWERAGLRLGEVEQAIGCTTGSHYFARSQWALPTAEHYAAMQRYANRAGGDYLRREYDYLRREYDYLRREYEDLRREYEDLRREYEDLRRPFTVSPEVPYTDAWTFPTVGAYPGKHPCEKPQDMLRHMITASSREGDVVLDAFAGGGSCGRAALLAGRRWIGIEKDTEWCASAAAALAKPHRTQVRRSVGVDERQGVLL